MNILFLSVILVIITIMQLMVDRSINRPIQALVESTRRLSKGDFNACVEAGKDANEITILNENFNRMIAELQILMDKIREDTRKKEQLELRLLQEQINPHFLYNTLEIIVWLAEAGDKDQVIRVVQSLSRFFRIVLSKGRAIITVKEELDCIQSYLYIQQMRYSDIVQYEICADEEALDYPIQKLTLQPLVENALYHGIEKKRGGGMIRVRVDMSGSNIVMRVSDNGAGMNAETLRKLQMSIMEKEAAESGFGLSNIQKRIQLSYGADYGVEVESTEGEGTTVTLKIPAIPSEEEKIENKS